MHSFLFSPEGEYATSPEFKLCKSKLESAEPQPGLSSWLPPTFITFLGLQNDPAASAATDAGSRARDELSAEEARQLADLLNSRQSAMLDAVKKLRTLMLNECSNTRESMSTTSISTSTSSAAPPSGLSRNQLCLGYWVLVDADLKRPLAQFRFLREHSFDVLLLVTPNYYYVLHDCYPEYQSSAAASSKNAAAASLPDWSGFLERVPLVAVERIEISMIRIYCTVHTNIFASTRTGCTS